MQLRGRIPADSPDPRIERRERLREMPAPVVGLAAQPALEDSGDLSVSHGRDSAGLAEFTVGISYTLWRNPADRSDPVNLAVLDDDTRAEIDRETPWQRPAWLIERVQRMRYPQIWEAVQTTWSRDVPGPSRLAWRLAVHAGYILANRYRDQAGRSAWPDPPGRAEELAGAVNPDVSVLLDGVQTPAAEIDTDPRVYAIGVQRSPAVTVTVVLPRDELRYIRLALATRPAASG